MGEAQLALLGFMTIVIFHNYMEFAGLDWWRVLKVAVLGALAITVGYWFCFMLGSCMFESYLEVLKLWRHI